MFLTDSFYGHRTILARWCGRPDGLAMWAHLQHGWNAAAGFGTKYVEGMGNTQTLDRRLPVLVWNERNRAACEEAGLTDVHVVGAPFAYLDRILDTGPHPAGEGTIAYPLHSGHGRPGSRGEAEYTAALLEREDGPVTVCLYWREEALAEVRSVYADAGFSVVCHGGREDPYFLHRQREALLAHRRVVTNRVSTALWYGALLGREIEVYGPQFASDHEAREAWWSEREHQWWPEVHAGPVAGAEAVAMGRDELGADHLREPEELAALLGWSGWRRPLTTVLGAAGTARRALRTGRNRR
ncbi:MAG TPA: hypothetical protein VF228_00625 [Iamia sp.]